MSSPADWPRRRARKRLFWTVWATYLIGYLVGLLTGWVMFADRAEAGETRRIEQCLFQRDDPGIWTEPEEERTMRCVLERWPVPGGITQMRSVGECESHWNRLARNHNVGDDYLGLFQHDEGSWPDRVTQAFQTLPRDWRLKVKWQNSRTQIIVTAWLARQQGWTPWSGCL